MTLKHGSMARWARQQQARGHRDKAVSSLLAHSPTVVLSEHFLRIIIRKYIWNLVEFANLTLKWMRRGCAIKTSGIVFSRFHHQMSS